MDLFDSHPEVFEAICAFVRKCGGNPINAEPLNERELEAALGGIVSRRPFTVECPDCSAVVVVYDD